MFFASKEKFPVGTFSLYFSKRQCFRKFFTYCFLFLFVCFCVCAPCLCLLRRSGGKIRRRGGLSLHNNNNILERKLPGCQLFKCWYLPTNTADVGQHRGTEEQRNSELRVRTKESVLFFGSINHYHIYVICTAGQGNSVGWECGKESQPRQAEERPNICPKKDPRAAIKTAINQQGLWSIM